MNLSGLSYLDYIYLILLVLFAVFFGIKGTGTIDNHERGHTGSNWCDKE